MVNMLLVRHIIGARLRGESILDAVIPVGFAVDFPHYRIAHPTLGTVQVEPLKRAAFSMLYDPRAPIAPMERI